MVQEEKYWTLCAEVFAETEKAIMIVDEDKEIWLPRSLIEEFGVADQNKRIFSVPDWLIRKKQIPGDMCI